MGALLATPPLLLLPLLFPSPPTPYSSYPPSVRSPSRWIKWARRRTECNAIILTVLQRRQRRTLSSVFWALRHRVLTKVGVEI